MVIEDGARRTTDDNDSIGPCAKRNMMLDNQQSKGFDVVWRVSVPVKVGGTGREFEFGFGEKWNTFSFLPS